MPQFTDPSPPRCSPLQLAWLQELGIDKPWLPAVATTAVAVPAPATVAGVQGTQVAPTQAPAESRKTAPESLTRVPSPLRSHSASPGPASSPPPPLPQSATPARSKSAVGEAGSSGSAAGLSTRDLAAAARDLDALTETVVACQACGLCKTRHKVVVGEGVAQPAVMVIGEAPGEQEDRQGLPFVGRSGMLLDNMLATVGASRQSNVYVANVIKCRPPGNRNPRPEESAACHPYLMRQIELVNPRVILLLGRVAAQAMLETDASMQSLRHRSLSLTVAGRVIPAIASYHPAYLLRRPTEKAAAWEDLQRLKATIDAGS